MAFGRKRAPLVLSMLALLMAVVCSVPAGAQQPVNPTAESVNEQQLFQQGPIIRGRGTIPDIKSYNLEQPAGRDWRHFHEVTLRWVGGISILGMLALLLVFYLFRGMVRIDAGRDGRRLVRFSGFERFIHWTTATCFVLLALTGLNITFGKELLMPLIGQDAFAAWAQWAKYIHNYLSFPFSLGVVTICLMWIAWNIPDRGDIRWLEEGGGIVGHKHPPADRFNAGQKAVYWIVVLGGAAMAASGYVLMLPFFGTDIARMQDAQMVHAIAAVLFFAVMIAHAYIGTIGMEGAIEAMWDGTVDVNWAKEHHSLWYQKEKERGHVARPSQDARPPGTPPGRMEPAE